MNDQIKSETLRNSLGSYEESVHSAFENLALGLKAVVAGSIIIAETEAEERHAKEIEALKDNERDRAIKAFCFCGTCHNISSQVRDEEVCPFESDCRDRAEFIQKLNEK